MSYIVFSRWTPRDAQAPSAGWMPVQELKLMANHRSHIRQVVGSIDVTDAELEAIFSNYLRSYGLASEIISSVGQLASYSRKSSDPRLTMTLMQFPSESSYAAIEQAPGWERYRIARNAMLDILNVKMEVKRYISLDPLAWSTLSSKTAEQLSVIFDSMTNADPITYP